MKMKDGTKVVWSGGWNTEPEQIVTITSISKGDYFGDKYGDIVDDIDWCDKDICVFDLDNGHWCYGNQIHAIVDGNGNKIVPDDAPNEKEYRISFRAEVYVKGKTLKDVRYTFEELPLFSADALENYGAEFIELQNIERVDNESYKDVTTEYYNN